VSGQLLLVLRLVLLGLLYLFLFRVVRAVWAEISPTRQVSEEPAAAVGRRRARGPSGVPLSAPPVRTSAGVPEPPPAPPPQPAALASTTASVASELVVIAPDDLAGQRHVLSGDTVTLGRGAPATVVFDDSFVSKVHARLRRQTEGWVIEDLGSTNGTIVNGQPLTGVHLVRPGEVVTVGSVTLEVR
jgi:hypothetical protein